MDASGGAIIASRLAVSNEQIVQQGPGEFFRTSSFTVPKVIITKTVPRQASRRVDIAADGTIAGLLAFNAGAGDHDGTGYAANTLTVSIEPVFAGAPGSGAAVTLTNFNTAGQWPGTTNFSLANPGSGYKQNVNRATQAFSGGGVLTAKPGDVIVRDIENGVGRRNVQVQ